MLPRLVHRHILEDGTCEECDINSKSLFHLSWECPKACETGMALELFLSVSSVQFRSFMNLLWFVLMEERWQDEDSALAITMVWALWTNRNDVRHGGLKKNGKQNFR